MDPNLNALDDLKAWVGRSETIADRIGATPVKALDATLEMAPRYQRHLHLPLFAQFVQ